MILELTDVTIMQLAPTATDHTCANVKMDSLEMDLHAMVKNIFYVKLVSVSFFLAEFLF